MTGADGCVKPHRHVIQSQTRFPVRKVWQTAVEKAGEDDAYVILQRIADAATPQVRQAFLDAIQRIRGTIQEQELRDALERGDIEGALRALDLENRMRTQLNANMTAPLEDVLLAAGRAAPALIKPPRGGQITMRFDVTNPKVAQFIRDYDFSLIRQISQESRDAVRDVVLNAVRFGGHPVRDQAKQIMQVVGLTTRQANAVGNYRSALEEEGREGDQVDRMVDAYQNRVLRQRANNIARTETIRASNAGQTMAWDQAADKGLLNRGSMRRQWLVTPDDRLCVFCAAVPALNPGGQPIGGMFTTPLGPVAYPPLHPQCRCATVIANF